MSKKWRVAKSLDKLLAQLNTLFPNRSKVSDGSIGDQRHQASKSDHNPNEAGVVTARDFTHDPGSGLDCNRLAAALIASRDPRIKYIIWNHRILSSKVAPWQWRPYTGANAHTKHLHLSVDPSAKLYDDEREWFLNFVPATPAKPLPFRTMRKGDRGEDVRRLQQRLKEFKFLAGEADGIFGLKTEQAVKSAQFAHKLRVDGIAGENTARALGLL